MAKRRNRKKNSKAGIIVVVIIVIAVFFYFSSRQPTVGAIAGEDNIVLHLTFDDPSNPWYDSSPLHHDVTPHGNVGLVNGTLAKYYYSADFSKSNDGSDYLETNMKPADFNQGIAISWWAYATSTEQPFGWWLMSVPVHDGNQYDTAKRCQESSYGMVCNFKTTAGEINTGTGQSNNIFKFNNQWEHYFVQFKGNKIQTYRNGVLISDKTVPDANILYQQNELLFIGKIQYGIDAVGYMDEFTIYDKGDFTDSEVQSIFNAYALGTPPNVDVYVQNIEYSLPFDWNSKYKDLPLQTLPVTFTITNAGQSSTGSFTYSADLDTGKLCSGTLSLKAFETKQVTCNLDPQYHFYNGFMTLNINDDNNENNKQRIYIPYLSRPMFHFNLNEWNNDLKPYCVGTTGTPAYSMCQWIAGFVSEPFQEGWIGDTVDPRAKKGRENAMGCLYDDYNPNSVRCQRALEYVKGWGTRPINSYSNVQSVHELAHAGITLDIMMPLLDEETFNTVANQYEQICQHITELASANRDIMNTLMRGGNGWGFGAGMGGFCYSIIGLPNSNPTLIQHTSQSYWGKNVPDMWMHRESSFLRAYKNDAFANYQEGSNYKNYAEPHILENAWFQKRYGLNNVDNYNNAFCSMARETLSQITDCQYNGQTLRNDRPKYCRIIQRGDSYSYQFASDGSFPERSMYLYEALLCDDKDVKSAMLTFFDYIIFKENARGGYPTAYLYKLLKNEAEPKTVDSVMPKVLFDNANDILTIRPTYSYVNDDIIQIDGGEERGSGHSQAQGYYLYALGEPFLDYEQVPYNDDVRTDTWKNGISLRDAPQTSEGTFGVWNSKLGQVGYNQYFGMIDAPIKYYPDDYPDFRNFPAEYGGDLSNYIGSKDGGFAGVYVTRPYSGTTTPVKEYFVKFNDVLAKRTVVNATSGGIYHNFIDINDEFNENRDAKAFTLTRVGTTKTLKTQVLYSSTPLELGGGRTNVAYCFGKTSCSGSSRGLGTYRRLYYYTPESSVDFILSHSWYDNPGSEIGIDSVNQGNDKGLKQGDDYIIFDTNDDGKVTFGNYEADGWAIVLNSVKQDYGAFDSTYFKVNGQNIITSSEPISYFIKGGYLDSINTMKPGKGIDHPTTVTLSFNGQTFRAYSNQNSNLTIGEYVPEEPPIDPGTKKPNYWWIAFVGVGLGAAGYLKFRKRKRKR